MFIKDYNFNVKFSSYAEKHFCKGFLKKYNQKPWGETRKTIILMLIMAFNMQKTEQISNLSFNDKDSVGIFKLKFKVANTNTSPKSSWNRVVFALSNNDKKIEILIVYSKNDIGKKSNETEWIMWHIKDNFPEYEKYC